MKHPSCHHSHHLRFPSVAAPTISGMKYLSCHCPAIADLEINEIQNVINFTSEVAGVLHHVKRLGRMHLD